MQLVIRNGEIVTPGSRFHADLAIADGKVAQMGGEIATPPGVREIDASGKYVLPGGVDMHVHLSPAFVPAGIGPGGVATADDGSAREHVQTWSDDFASGSRAAAAGGITTIGNMTFAHVGERPSDAIERTAREAERDSLVDFVLHPVLLSARGMADQLPELAQAGCASIKFFMMFPGFDAEAADHVALMEEAARCGLITMVHCEDACVIERATSRLIAAGHTHPSNYGASRPVTAEAMAVTRVAAYAEVTRSPLYIVHLSSRAALVAAEAARDRGVQVHVETRPIYLLFDDSYLSGPEGPLYIGNPPLRQPDDVAALWAGIASGAVDTCGTDHAPAPRAEKLGADRDITNVSPGTADLETMLPLLYSRGVHTGRISLERFVEVTATNAAKIFGLYPRKGTIAVGSDADLAIWDPAADYTFWFEDAQSRSDYSLYDNWQINGRVVTTISRGEVIYDRGQFPVAGGRGQFLRRRPPEKTSAHRASDDS